MATKLYTVASINRRTEKQSPRFDLGPMNHAAACNFMDACRSEFTDYVLIDWPAEVPHPCPPLLSATYRKVPLYQPKPRRRKAA